MALVTDTIVFTTQWQPFERPPDAMTVRTAIPRGIRSFTLRKATAVKPLNDTYLGNFTAQLPPNFAYLMSDFGFTFQVNTASDLASVCTIRLADFLPIAEPAAASFFPVTMKLLSIDGVTNGASSALVEGASLPRMVLFGAEQLIGVQASVRIANLAAAAMAAGTITSFMSFYEYDLEQARNFPVNSPVIVSLR